MKSMTSPWLGEPTGDIAEIEDDLLADESDSPRPPIPIRTAAARCKPEPMILTTVTRSKSQPPGGRNKPPSWVPKTLVKTPIKSSLRLKNQKHAQTEEVGEAKKPASQASKHCKA